jgi:hypothetical protein
MPISTRDCAQGVAAKYQAITSAKKKATPDVIQMSGAFAHLQKLFAIAKQVKGSAEARTPPPRHRQARARSSASSTCSMNDPDLSETSASPEHRTTPRRGMEPDLQSR